MAKAWKELKGTRQPEDAPPHHMDYVITFTAATGEALPAGGEKIADITGSGTLPSTGLDAEPEAVQVSARIYATPTKDHVTVRFRGLYAV